MSFLYLRTTQKYRLSVGAGFEARLNGLPAFRNVSEEVQETYIGFSPGFYLSVVQTGITI